MNTIVVYLLDITKFFWKRIKIPMNSNCFVLGDIPLDFDQREKCYYTNDFTHTFEVSADPE